MSVISHATALPLRVMAQGPTVLLDGNGVSFRIWAPQASSVQVLLESDPKTSLPLSREPDGFFSAAVPDVKVGERYWYQIDGQKPIPDPASQFQPMGTAGPSEIVDLNGFHWTDASWPGITIAGQVIYEMHIGTFTPEGTYRAAAKLLPTLKNLGVTVLELMPLSSFDGDFGWGYDGVFSFAPYQKYGSPQDLAQFVNEAHNLGPGVILDVVYNHFGPTGNILPVCSPFYFSNTHKTDWGPALNYDGEHSQPVREFVTDNAAYWIRFYHFDGLRVDATQDVRDESTPHILQEIVQSARQAAGQRNIIMVGENEPQQAFYVQPRSSGGYGFDALWNDDFHHSSMVALAGKAEAYYSDYRGQPQEFISSLKYGYLYQGQWYAWQNQPRGTVSLDLTHPALVCFLQNHDQVANSATGQRINALTSPGKLRALTALTLLGPATPMLFQGQEYASATPFLYFADHCDQLADNVRAGRRDFLKQWSSMKDSLIEAYLADPCVPETFKRCQLHHDMEMDRNAAWWKLHHDLLQLRREDPILSKQGLWGLDGAILGPECFLIRFFSPQHADDRLLLVNLGVECKLTPLPEPLLAPPPSRQWNIVWCSDNPGYGGAGIGSLINDGSWRISGQCATLLSPVDC